MRERLALLGVLGATLVALAAILSLRLARGDVYPPASSLRPDPLGAKVLHEALRAMPGLTVERSFEPLDRLELGPATTIFLLDVDAGDELLARQAIAQATRGARVVVTLGSRPSHEPSNAVAPTSFPVLIATALGLELRLEPFPSGHRSVAVGRAADAPTALPETLAWSGEWLLEARHPGWHPIYRRGEAAVAAERAVGSGSLVVATDDWHLSNQGLADSRDGRWPAWLVGSASRVVFDETHLGTARQVGIATLLRRYRLTGGVLGLLIAAALALWSAASPLRPRVAARSDRAAQSAPRDVEGLGRLLERRLAGPRLAAALVESVRDPNDPALARELDAVATTDPVATWNALHTMRARPQRGGSR